MTLIHKLTAAALLVSLCACQPLSPTPVLGTATPPPAPTAAQTIQADVSQGVAVSVQVVSAGVQLACQYGPTLLNIAGTLARGGAANTVTEAKAILNPSCTPQGQVALTANDAAPVTATNSGNSAAWAMSVAANALIAAAMSTPAPTVK